MDWEFAIGKHREALVRVVAMLFAAAGLAPGGLVAVLPRYLRSEVLRLLVSTEAALRRLLVISAREVVVAPPVERSVAGRGPLFARLSKGCADRVPGFALLDPMRRVALFGEKRVAGPGPRLTVIGLEEPESRARRLILPDDPVDARRLCQRLQAVQNVLDDLPKYTRRMARWLAKRKRAGTPGRMRPMRSGRPPGHRKRGRHQADEVLANLHALALYALVPP